MKIVHKFSTNDLQKGYKSRALQSLGIQFSFLELPSPAECESPNGLLHFEILENSVEWSRVRELLDDWDVSERIETRFTSKDFTTSHQFALTPSWHHGYPMPDLDDGYIDLTYDTMDGCKCCGIGWLQKSPFRMKGEPKWGKRQILQLNWVFDEYFVTPEVYEAVFKPFGIPSRKVLHHKAEKPLNSVVQLVIDNISKDPLNIQHPPDEICDQCRQGKFHPHTRGYFPKLLGNAHGCIFKSREYFGSGGSAWRAVIVSNELYQAMRGFGIKGVTFYPLAE